MELLTQDQVELRMYTGGIKRAENMMARAEEKGRANTNPYAKQVMRDYVLPLAEVIKSDLAVKQPGRQQAHIQLLRPLSQDAVAFLAVRTALNACMDPKGGANDRTLGYKIGTAVHSELVLAQIEDEFPELYYTLCRDLDRRMSKSERHRMTVMRMQAEKRGFFFIEWPLGARQQVGSYLLGLMVQAGMLHMEQAVMTMDGKWGHRDVTLSESLMQDINETKHYLAVTMPVFGPCVAPPKDWTTVFDGGYHTKELRRVHRRLITTTGSVAALYRGREMPKVFAAVNAMQRTSWRVNERILDTVRRLSAAGVETEEIVSALPAAKPPPPGWLTKEMTKEDMSPERLEHFKDWKKLVSEWHTNTKLRAIKFSRFYAATRAADMFVGYPELYFVYFLDTRGRAYPLTYGLSPQGSDLQKSLITFAEGKPLATESALRWFHIQGANKFGFDKATLEERFMFAHERGDEWVQYANDPVNLRGWLEADSPLQFLAWCFEYAEWRKNPQGFLSYLPVSMDGSCNGLQNLSAMLRDEVGGYATNLTANPTMQDIYRLVAERALSLLNTAHSTRHGGAWSDEQMALCEKWISHGISRSVVKRSVMTTPYGVTHRSAVDYVIEDYLKKVQTPFVKTEFRAAAQILMSAVWPAIGEVVVKGRLAMDWLKQAARKIVKTLPQGAAETSAEVEPTPATEPVITWVTPSGFMAVQAYFEYDVHRINTRLVGPEKIRVVAENDKPDATSHASGMAPNFVHSCDAAHLHLVAAEARNRGITSLAMIHDDYGTHAADSEALYHLIREMFVWMYENNNPIRSFHAMYPFLPEPPEPGNLDIRQVLESKFFFS